MTTELKHRGPDHQNSFHWNMGDTYVSMGHCRLSVLDPSEASNQPLSYEGLDIVFNGEIYNFQEIKDELINKNHEFQTRGDTEVILHAVREWGLKDALLRFRGMFAFAILDRDKKQLFLVRDRVGVKPLYYFFDQFNLIFGSELRSLRKHPQFKQEISYKALVQYLQYGYVRGEQSIYSHCFRLSPGSILTLDISNFEIKQHKYWSIIQPIEQKNLKIDYKEVKYKLNKILNKSFSLRMVSDVPVGIFLSSGYDSSCVAAILSKSYKNLNTFTIGFESQGENEAHYAKRIAHILNTNHREFYCTEKEALEISKKIPDIYDEPFGDSSAIPTILVSKFAKEYVKVVLSADGGDEIFYGYNHYKSIENIYSNFLVNNSFSRFFLKAFLLTSSFVQKMLPIYNLKTRIQKILDITKVKSYRKALSSTVKIMTQDEVSKLTTSSMEQEIEEFSSIESIRAMSIWDIENYLPDDILVKVDRSTMSNSLEGREPFLDQNIIEFVQSVPMKFIKKENRLKFLIKDIVHDHLPKELMDRPKTGFSVPLGNWLLGPLKKYVDSVINKNVLQFCPELDSANVLKIKNDFYKKPNIHNPQKIWIILNYLAWKRRWHS